MPVPRLTPFIALLLGTLAATAAVGLVRSRPSVRQPPAAEVEPTPPDSVVILTRTWARAGVAREVIAGRMTVPAAAAVFEWLNGQNPVTSASRYRTGLAPEHKSLTDLAGSEAELLCLHVTVFVKVTPGVPASRVEEVVEEYRRACATPGGVVLPEVVEADCRELWARAAASAIRATQGSNEGGTDVSLDGLRLVVGR